MSGFGEENKRDNRGRIALIVLGVLWLIFSGLTLYFYSETSTLQDKNTQVEAKKKELENEIDQLDQQLATKDTELLSKEGSIKDLNTRLEQAKARLNELEGMRAFQKNKADELRNKLKEYEVRISSLTVEKTEVEGRVRIVEVKSDSLLKRITDLQSDNDRQKGELEKQQGQITQLNSTINNIYNAFDFKFTDSKDQTDLVLKKGKVRKGLKVAFSLTDYDNRPVNKVVPELSLEIRGIDRKNSSFRKTFDIEDISGGKASVSFENEEFNSGVYHLQAKYQGRLIGDASFLVK